MNFDQIMDVLAQIKRQRDIVKASLTSPEMKAKLLADLEAREKTLQMTAAAPETVKPSSTKS